VNRSQFLGIAFRAWGDVFRIVPKGGIWFPFILISCLQGATLLFLTSFHQPGLLPVGVPLVKLLGTDNAVHYPLLYIALPTMFSRMNLAIGVLIASITGGAATILFAKAFGFKGETNTWQRALRCAPSLIIISILIFAFMYGISCLQGLVPEEMTLNSGKIRWGVRGARMAVFVIMQGFMIYTTSWIVLMGHKFGPAIRDSFRVTSATFLPTMFIVAVPTALLYPFSYALTRIDIIMQKFKPELVAGIIGVEIVVQLIFMFFMVGAITRLFVWRAEAAK
jgi:hypothetical protein